MFERYTEKARRVIFFGRYEASQFGSPYIETEHLLMGLLREDKALTNRILRTHATVESIRKQIMENTAIREKVSTSVDLPLSDEAKRVLAYAAEEAEQLGHKHIGTEHLLLGLLREESCFAAQILKQRGLELGKVREDLARDPHPVEPPRYSPGPGGAASPTEFSRDLTQAASNGELGPIIGRDRELDGVIEVIASRNCCNPVLVGDRGTGKTAIVEALANRIADGNAPQSFAEARVLVFDLQAALGASRISQLREHLEATLKTIGETPTAILYIGELRTVMRPAAELGLGGLMGILLHAPSDARVRCIATATSREYEECIRQAPWITSAFRAVHVHPLSEEDTLKVLESRRPAYEKYHEVTYSPEALAAAAQLAGSYLPDRATPGKALQLLDAAGARARLQQGVVPEEVAEVKKRLRFITHRLEGAVQNHEFEKARFYSDEERKERQKLHVLQEISPAAGGHSGVVSRGDIEQTIARWAEYPYQP